MDPGTAIGSSRFFMKMKEASGPIRPIEKMDLFHNDSLGDMITLSMRVDVANETSYVR